MNQIAQQESCPGIARSRIGHQKYVVRIDADPAPGKLPAREHTACLGYRSQSPLHFVLAPRHFGSASLRSYERNRDLLFGLTLRFLLHSPDSSRPYGPRQSQRIGDHADHNLQQHL